MNDHYQDYLKKSVSADDLVFDEIKGIRKGVMDVSNIKSGV